MVLAAVLAAIVGLGVLADSLVAARVERNISERIYHEANLATPPHVQVTGMPYLAAVRTHEVPSIQVEASDVEIPGFGRVTVASSATEVTLGRDAVLTGEFTDAPARQVFTRIQMDTVELGEHMGMDDLALSSQDDSSPRGGWETAAYMSGTPGNLTGVSGSDEGTYEVAVRLRIRQGDVHLTATEVTGAPGFSDPGDISDDLREQVLDAFSLHMSSDDLPFDTQPGRVYTVGGSLFIETEQYFTRVSVSDLAPRSGPLSEEERAGL